MRPALSRNVAASVLNACAAVATSLVTVPLILDAVGTAGYGVWTLGLALVLYASILETGLGPGVQRFTAFARGRRDEEALGRIAVDDARRVRAAGGRRRPRPVRLAPLLVDLFDLPRRLQHDAEEMFRMLGGALALTLLAAGAANVAQGLERFGMLALSTAAGAVAFLAAVVVLADRARPARAGRCRLHRPGRDADRPQRRVCAAWRSPAARLMHAARAPARHRLLRPPSGHACSPSSSTGRATSWSSGSSPARDRRPARHRRAVRRRRAAALRRRPLPRPNVVRAPRRQPATRRGCPPLPRAAPAVGARRPRAAERSAPPRCRR